MRRAAASLMLLLLALGGGCKEQPAFDEPAAPQPSAPPPAPGELQVHVVTTPAQPRPGTETRVSLRIVAPSGPLPRLESVANSPVHLVAVDRELTWYEHVHPRPDGDAYTAVVTFPAPGEYVLHTIARPANEPQVVRKQLVTVGEGTADAPRRPLAISSRQKRSGHYTIRLRSDPEPPATGGWTSLIFEISRDGQPVTNLTPTGTLGHTVILREGAEDFVYAHSTDGEAMSGVRARKHLPAVPPSIDNTHRRHIGDTGPEVTFHTQFPHVGKYKMWVELIASRESIKADFVVEVGEPKPSVHVHSD